MRDNALSRLKRYVTLLLLASFCQVSIADPDATSPPKRPPNCIDWSDGTCRAYWVSMIQLIGSPERYDGKRVMTEGFIHIDEHQREGKNLYVHREDYLHNLYKNGLWVIDVPGGEKCQDAYVSVIGVFSSDTGHMGASAGSIRIERCRPVD